MLPKRQRLTSADLRRRPLRTIRFPLFTVRMFPAAKEKGRLSATVPVSVSKKASERNRMRRTIYRAANGIIGNLNRFDLLVVASASLRDRSESEISQALEQMAKTISS